MGSAPPALGPGASAIAGGQGTKKPRSEERGVGGRPYCGGQYQRTASPISIVFGPRFWPRHL